MATILQVLKETAMRIGEAMRLKWTDIDLERRIITINEPEKHSESGSYQISPELLGMLQTLPKKSEKIFPLNPRYMNASFARTRKRIAAKLQNPRLTKITFHTFRHWKATMLAHQTKQPFYVQKFLRQKTMKATLKYVHLEQLIFAGQPDEYHTAVAETVEQAQRLIETGFEKHDEFNGVHIYRRRK